MPGGGLTALTEDIKNRPDEVKRVIRALQTAKDMIRQSKEKSVELMMRILKMDKEIAGDTYDVFLKTLSKSGVPTPAGMDNLVKSIQGARALRRQEPELHGHHRRSPGKGSRQGTWL